MRRVSLRPNQVQYGLDRGAGCPESLKAMEWSDAAFIRSRKARLIALVVISG